MTVVSGRSLDFAELPGRRSADPLGTMPHRSGEQSSARYVCLGHDPSRTAHRHPFSEEIIYVVTGSGYVWLEGQRLPVTAGDIVQIPTGAAHATVPDPGVEVELMCFFPHPDLSSNIIETDIAVAVDHQGTGAAEKEQKDND